jgi:SAM-dependent methyltransferase
MDMKRNQKAAFLDGEGDAYFARNLGFDESDPVVRAVTELEQKPTVVLEIGCAGGHRLAALHNVFEAECFGVEPSAEAVNYAKTNHPRIFVEQGTADALPFEAARFDLVIFGCCLCWCDPEDLFSIASEADRVLTDGGFLAIYDFIPPQPFKNVYHHKPGLFTYKMQFLTMFTWHPMYRHLLRRYTEKLSGVSCGPNETFAVDVLRKDIKSAYPLNPWSSP